MPSHTRIQKVDNNTDKTKNNQEILSLHKE